MQSQVVNNPADREGVQTQNLINEVLNEATPYTAYVAKLTQTGTDAPVAVRYDSNFSGVTMTWARTSAGLYTLTASTATFTAGKTFAIISGNQTSLIETVVAYTSTTVVTITTNVMSESANVLIATATDALLDGGLIEIRVYS